MNLLMLTIKIKKASPPPPPPSSLLPELKVVSQNGARKYGNPVKSLHAFSLNIT